MPRAAKTKTDYTQSKLLGEISEAKKALIELRQNRAEAARGQLLVADPSEPHKYTQQEIEATRETQAYLDQTDHEIRRLEGELRKAWDYYGGLADTTGRVSVPAEVLEAEIAALTERRRVLDRRAGSFAEDAHDAIDQIVQFHNERVDSLLQSWPIGAGEMIEVAAAWSWRDPELLAALHAAVDQHEFPAGSRTAWLEQLHTIARQIARRQSELELRRTEAEARQAEQKKQAAEKQLAAIQAT